MIISSDILLRRWRRTKIKKIFIREICILMCGTTLIHVEFKMLGLALHVRVTIFKVFINENSNANQRPLFYITTVKNSGQYKVLQIYYLSPNKPNTNRADALTRVTVDTWHSALLHAANYVFLCTDRFEPCLHKYQIWINFTVRFIFQVRRLQSLYGTPFTWYLIVKIMIKETKSNNRGIYKPLHIFAPTIFSKLASVASRL